ncbi:MAG: hypothetical protein Q4C64_06785 [Erysipelotrichia bacterium]|nr:hypothetical protein [Erysipelotrichia bacterium]
MYKKRITFKNYNGEEISEDYYFNINKAEMLELEAQYKDGLKTHLQELLEKEDTKSIFEFIKLLILLSVGKKSDDGRLFIKNDTILNDFQYSEAYPTLLYDLFADETLESIKIFFEHIIPSE